MLLSAVSVLVVAQSSSEIQEGLMNNPVLYINSCTKKHYLHEHCAMYNSVARTEFSHFCTEPWFYNNNG